MIKIANMAITGKGIEFVDKDGNKLESATALSKITNRIKSYIEDANLFLLHLVTLHVPIYTIRKVFLLANGVTIGKGSKIHTHRSTHSPNLYHN